MKTIALTLASMAAAALSLASARGVCYDPAHTQPTTVDSIKADLDTIKNNGFDSIRTYFTKFADTDLGSLAMEKGLNVSLGIPFGNGGQDTEVHVQAAIAAAQKGLNAQNAGVTQIYVGNENLAKDGAVPGDMVGLIQRIKGAVPTHVKVGTVQRNTEYLDHNRVNAVPGMRELYAACDIVGVNMHPFFTPNTPADRAITVINDQWVQLHGPETENKFPGIASKFVITEVGWPTNGRSDAGNAGSPDGAARVYHDFKQWASQNNIANDQSFYFQMFDQPYRTDRDFEQHFGITEETGQIKFQL